MQGLDVEQEQSFVLSLSGAAQVPSTSCRVLSVYTRSADKQTDVSFEVDVETVMDAEEYARKIGRLTDEGRLTAALSTNALPRAFARFRPVPHYAGLPVPLVREDDRTFSAGFILGLVLPLLAFGIASMLAIFKYQVLEKLELYFRLVNEHPPEDGWDSAITSPRNWHRNPNSPFASADLTPREVVVEQDESFADILSSMRNAGNFSGGDKSGETEMGESDEPRAGDGTDPELEWKIETGKAIIMQSSAPEYLTPSMPKSAAVHAPVDLFIPELVQIGSKGTNNDLYGLNLSSVPLLSPSKMSPSARTERRDYGTRETFSPTLAFIDPLERCTSSFPASPQGTLDIIPEEESNSARHTPVDGVESDNNGGLNYLQSLILDTTLSSAQRNSKRNNSQDPIQRPRTAHAPPPLSTLTPAPYNLPKDANSIEIDQGKHGDRLPLLPTPLSAQKEDSDSDVDVSHCAFATSSTVPPHDPHFRFKAPFQFKGGMSSLPSTARKEVKEVLPTTGSLPLAHVVRIQRMGQSSPLGEGGSAKEAGIGLAFERDPEGNHSVIGMRRDGSAALSNQIHIHDQMLAVNGVSTQGQSVEEVSRMIVGAEGTTVALTLMRPDPKENASTVKRHEFESFPTGALAEEAQESVLESAEAIDYLVLANDLQSSQYFESSLEYYDTGLEKAKGFELKSALLFNRSVAHARLRHWDQALHDVIECLKLRPGWQPAVNWQEACLEQFAQSMDDGLSTMSDQFGLHTDNAGHTEAAAAKDAIILRESDSMLDPAPAAREPLTTSVEQKSTDASPYGPFETGSPVDGSFQDASHVDRQRQTIMRMLSVLQEAERYVEEKVAGIKSVGLSHIAREHAAAAASSESVQPRSSFSVNVGAPAQDPMRVQGSKGISREADLQIEVVLDLDFNVMLGQEDDVKQRIERDLARAVDGDRRKLRVWKLSAGSVVAHVRLESGFAAGSYV